MSNNTPDFNDPINLQVMWNRLIFIADQADLRFVEIEVAALQREFRREHSTTRPLALLCAGLLAPRSSTPPSMRWTAVLLPTKSNG